jgi:hypothetical protein
MSAKSNTGEINESHAPTCQTQEISKFFVTLKEEKKWRLPQRRQDDVPTQCIRTACINIVFANLSILTLGCGPYTVLHSLFWIQSVLVTGTNIGAGDQSSVVHTWPPAKLSDMNLYIFEKKRTTANIKKRREIKMYSTKYVFLIYILWTLNYSVAANGRPYSHFKSPTLDPNGKMFSIVHYWTWATRLAD